MNYYPEQYAEDERKQVGWALDSVPLVSINFELIEERELAAMRARIARTKELEGR